MEAVENQRQVSHRSHRPWKSLQDFHTPSARRLFSNKMTKTNAESVPNYRSSACLSLGVHYKLSPVFCVTCFLCHLFSEVDIPLNSRGKLIGIFNAQNSAIDAFSPEQIDLLCALADNIAIAIANARL